MNNPLTVLLPLVVTAAVLGGCSSSQPENTLTVTDIANLQNLPPLKGGIRVSSTILEDGKNRPFTPKQVGAGQKARFCDLKGAHTPVDYDLPETPHPKSRPGTPISSFPITPSTPTKFKTVKTGWSIDLTPRIQGAFVKIHVNVKRTTVEPKKGMFGEGHDPVFGETDGGLFGKKVWVNFTDNLSEFLTVHTEERSVVVRALPGKRYRVPLSDETTLLIEVESR